MKKKGINFPLGGRRDTENRVMDTVIFGNTFSSEPDLDIFLKHNPNRTECIKLIVPDCLVDECDVCTMVTNPEEMFIREETKQLHDKQQKKAAKVAKIKKKRFRGAIEIEPKIPSSNINNLLKKKEEKDKSKSYLKVVKNNDMAHLIDDDEILINHMGMRKGLALKKAHLL